MSSGQDQDTPGLIGGHVYINLSPAHAVPITKSGQPGGSGQDAACLGWHSLGLTVGVYVCVCLTATSW